MKLIITRHGETLENINGICQGHLPGTLSENGKLQAKKLALRFKDEKIDAIFSSDLARSSDTAKEIAKFHPEAKLEFVYELRECDHGSKNTGKHFSQIDWNSRDGMESRESMRVRSKKIIDRAYRMYPDGFVVFVGHNGVNRALISVIMDLPEAFMARFGPFLNTSVSVFEIKENRQHLIHLLNCAKHLD
ncbi:MAG: histidine phosphatase family protein [Nanoarchaeota archaeon]|nr:histidine phosphatase family protein [Nanoarchaeota archaeon]MBU1031283.1 histidine phosphatase family protein [Nanoarchaeota archaeon]MBU1849513.1 histidine phosphatase family protein [Nanoarchaeota archaeon]